MKASEILRKNSTGYMSVGIGALQKLIRTLKSKDSEVKRLQSEKQQLIENLDIAQQCIIDLETTTLLQRQELALLNDTTFRMRLVDSIELD